MGAFDILNREYTGETFNVSTQALAPQDITFNDDGSKVYIIDATTQNIVAYDLGTNYDVSTAIYNGESFNVGGEETSPRGLDFNNDGSKVYIIGETAGTIFAYDLGTNYDVSTAFYNGESFLTPQALAPQDITFNDDGSKVYIIDATANNIVAYDLGTNYDVSTAVYNGESFNVGGEETSPMGITFNDDGSKVYIVGIVTDAVYAYDLNTLFDVSTAVYNDEFLSVDQENNITGLVFSSTGFKLYIIGSDTDSIYVYEIITPLTNEIIKLTNQLYPTGRAWKLDIKSIFRKFHEGLAYSEARAINAAKDILHTILPDNDNFTEENAERWEIALGLTTDLSLTLDERKLLIERKMQHPGNIPARQHYLYLQGQLQAAGFDVYVQEFITNPVNPVPAIYGIPVYGQTVYGGTGIDDAEIIANYIDSTKDEDYNFGIAENLNFSFFIGGETFPNRADVSLLQKQNFRELILKIKPAHTGGFLLIDYI